MKELNRKVFKTIFLILSLFIVTGIAIYNVSSYKKEYNDVKRNLSFMDDKTISKPDGIPPEPKEFNDSMSDPKSKDLDNMMIMDYEVYSIKLNNKRIEKIINHSNNTSDFDVKSIAKTIISNGEKFKIGNLYTSNYSYRYIMDTIVIINTKNINDRLVLTLGLSIIILIGFEVIVYFISKVLTKRITKPAGDAFDKQRDFIADASHELKTPLAVIMASSDELKSDKKNEKYVDNIKYESERMSVLIKSLLDLSKLEKGIEVDNYKEENISKIIERICLTFESVAFEQSIKIDTNIEKDIVFKCSKEEIERLISIIIDNAIKHSYKKSTINVNVIKEKNIINIDIINRGDPIKPVESRNRDANRYGLGLAIAKKIVTNHNGIIKAYSKDGKTVFKIILKK